MKRGHKSHVGVGFVIEVETGMVVNFKVLYNYFSACNKRMKSKSQDLDARMEAHKPKCHKNFDRNAAAMEAEAASCLWRCLTQHCLRYTTFIGDGDSSTYNTICALNEGQGPYDVPIIKEECVNHVSKQLGTCLCKLKQEDVMIITTKTGKTQRRSELGGANKLAENVINKLTKYYGNAIRDNRNKTVASMRDEIMASYFHAFSCDESPQLHRFCPQGETSRCFYNRALDKGETSPLHA